MDSQPVERTFEILQEQRNHKAYLLLYERAVKDFVMGRNNFLFRYSEKGIEASSTLMTVIRTTKLNQVDPEKYIAYVLTQLRKKRQSDIESLHEEVRLSKHEVPMSIIDSLQKDR